MFKMVPYESNFSRRFACVDDELLTKLGNFDDLRNIYKSLKRSFVDLFPSINFSI